MSENIEKKEDKVNKNRRSLTPVFVILYITVTVLLVLVTILLSMPKDDVEDNNQLASVVTLFNPENQTDHDYLSAPASEPVVLRIPSIDLVAEFEDPLDLNEDRTIEVPESFDKVARYKYTPTPGETGPSVILGHVDSLDGPAVFYPLREVKEGDLVEIAREDGTVVVFEVSKTEVVEQGDFPGAKVYGTIPYAGVRLITCTGIYDRDAQRYSHNFIVYGELKEIVHPVDVFE